MEHIGYSLVDKTGVEVKFWGNNSGQMEGIPDFVNWPSGDRTYCPTSGMQNDGAVLVPRMLEIFDGEASDERIEFKLDYVLVSRRVTM